MMHVAAVSVMITALHRKCDDVCKELLELIRFAKAVLEVTTRGGYYCFGCCCCCCLSGRQEKVMLTCFYLFFVFSRIHRLSKHTCRKVLFTGKI